MKPTLKTAFPLSIAVLVGAVVLVGVLGLGVDGAVATSIGVNLATWVYDALDGQSGWRGGNNVTVSDNVITGANHKGINTYTKSSTFSGNVIQDIALIENLGADDERD